MYKLLPFTALMSTVCALILGSPQFMPPFWEAVWREKIGKKDIEVIGFFQKG